MASPIFSYDARRGSYIADTGQIGASGSFQIKQHGYALSNSLIYFNNINFQTSKFSIVIAANLMKKNGNATPICIGTQVTGGNFMLITYTSTTLLVQFGLAPSSYNTISTITIPYNKDSLYIFNVDFDLKILTVFLNTNKSTYSISSQAINPSGSKTLFIGAIDNVGSQLQKGHIYYIKYYNNILNQQDINELYIDFVNSKPINKPTIFQPNLSILKSIEI